LLLFLTSRPEGAPGLRLCGEAKFSRIFFALDGAKSLNGFDPSLVPS
jgi:hypothetical protein